MKVYIVVGGQQNYDEFIQENVKVFSDEQAAQNFADELEKDHTNKFTEAWVEEMEVN